jgi:hypothetical protein
MPNNQIVLAVNYLIFLIRYCEFESKREFNGVVK